MKFAEYNEDYGRNEFGNQFEKEVTQMTALQSLLTGNELSSEELPLIREFKTVQEFLDLPVNDKKEAILKKLFTSSIILAKNKGVLPFNLPNSPVEIASAVDEAVRTITVMDKVIEKGMPVVLDKFCMVMTKIYPPSIAVVPVIKSVERYITVATKVVIRKGIRTLAQAAKPIVQRTVTKVKSVARKALNFLKA